MTSPASPAVDFDRNRLSQGEMIAGVCGLLLIIFMFFDWYGAKASGSIGGVHLSKTAGGADAWESFSFIDILLFLLALIAVGVAVLRGLNRLPAMPYPPSVLVAAAGGLAVLLILFRIVDKPDFGGIPAAIGGFHFSVTLKIGVFLALLSAAGIAYGGWQAMQEAGTSFGDLAGGGGGGGAEPTAPLPGAGGPPASKEGPGAPPPGTSTGAPGGGGAPPPPVASDPVPGETAGETTPGLVGEPPAGGGTTPPGIAGDRAPGDGGGSAA